jgi:hypothetical protein
MNKKIGLVINYHYFVIIAMVMFMCMFMVIPPIFLSWLADDIYNSR